MRPELDIPTNTDRLQLTQIGQYRQCLVFLRNGRIDFNYAEISEKARRFIKRLGFTDKERLRYNATTYTYIFSGTGNFYDEKTTKYLGKSSSGSMMPVDP